MKLNSRRLIALLLLVLLSVGFGFAFDAVATAIEKHQYPMPQELAEYVSSAAEEFGLPETVLWAFVRTESRFASDLVSPDGAIGLLQLTPETFSMICTEILGEEEKSSELLYAPATNLHYGAALISSLYERYGVWETAYAAYFAGRETVDAWLRDPELVTPQGRLNIPDPDTAAYVEDLLRAVERYGELYFSRTP